MSTKSLDAVSLIALDLGTTNTRANLFDVADGQYRFIASGSSPSTIYAPFFDVGESIYQSLDKLQKITGRILLDKEANLIIPSQAGGEGADGLVVTYSCGRPLNLVTVGLLGDASLEAINELAGSVNGKVVESIGINDRRSIDERADAILAAKPDLILFAGGTDNGASRSVLKMSDLICRILQTMPAEERPAVFYCGNQALAAEVKDQVERFTAIDIAPNIRPEIDRIEIEKVGSALTPLINRIQGNNVKGLSRIATICNTPPESSATAAGKIVRFLSATNDPQKGVLAFDVGAGSSSVTAGFGSSTSVNSFPFGTGSGMAEFLKRANIEQIHQWLPRDISLEDLRDALYQKTLSPESLPATREALAIELAATRQILREMVREIRLRGGLTASSYDPIVASGATLTRGTSAAEILLTLLDGIQPAGITTLILDKHSIISSLGAVAVVQPYLPIQVLESSAFTNLATVVSPLSDSRAGTEILNVRLEYSDGRVSEASVTKGTLVALPLKPGETANLYLEPMHRTRIEASGLVEDFYKVNGGICGLIIDARGRPLNMPENEEEREELYDSWKVALGE